MQTDFTYDVVLFSLLVSDRSLGKKIFLFCAQLVFMSFASAVVYCVVYRPTFLKLNPRTA